MARPEATSSRTNSGVMTVRMLMRARKRLAGMLVAEIGLGDIGERPDVFAAQSFTKGDVLHLRCDDAALGVVHLGDVAGWVAIGGKGAAGIALQARKRVQTPGGLALAGELGVARGEVAVIPRLNGPAAVRFRIAAFLDPALAQARQAGANIDFYGGVGVGPGGIVDA